MIYLVIRCRCLLTDCYILLRCPVHFIVTWSGQTIYVTSLT